MDILEIFFFFFLVIGEILILRIFFLIKWKRNLNLQGFFLFFSFHYIDDLRICYIFLVFRFIGANWAKEIGYMLLFFRFLVSIIFKYIYIYIYF